MHEEKDHPYARHALSAYEREKRLFAKMVDADRRARRDRRWRALKTLITGV